jgi:thioredoxin reductase (NADPH)
MGGQLTTTTEVDNFPGYPNGVTGPEMMENLKKQAERFGADIRFGIATAVDFSGKIHRVTIDENKIIEAETVIIATGANPRKLNVPGEKEFVSKGVSYCAICDGPFFRNKTVAVIGGGNSAITDALFLSKIARKVFIAFRKDKLRATKILQDRARETSNIEFIPNTIAMEIVGNKGEIRRVEKIVLKDLKTEEIRELAIDGVFVYVGIHPNTEIVDVEKDAEGFIKTDRSLETSEKGIFAAGDCRDTNIWQIVSAVRDGALAATAANEYLESLKST